MRTVRWLVPALLIVAWLALGSVGGPFAGKLSNVAENDSSAFLPSSAESTAVSELEREFSAMDAIPAIVVAERGAGITEADQRVLPGKSSGEHTGALGLDGNEDVADTNEADHCVCGYRARIRFAMIGTKIKATG